MSGRTARARAPAARRGVRAHRDRPRARAHHGLRLSGLQADRDGLPGAESALLAGLGAAPRRSFGEAYTQSISPPLALGSLLTGLYASAIPMCGYSDFHRAALSSQAWCAALPAERATLPKALAAYGWRTASLHPDFLDKEAIEGQFEHDWRFPDTMDPHVTPGRPWRPRPSAGGASPAPAAAAGRGPHGGRRRGGSAGAAPPG